MSRAVSAFAGPTAPSTAEAVARAVSVCAKALGGADAIAVHDVHALVARAKAATDDAAGTLRVIEQLRADERDTARELEQVGSDLTRVAERAAELIVQDPGHADLFSTTDAPRGPGIRQSP